MTDNDGSTLSREPETTVTDVIKSGSRNQSDKRQTRRKQARMLFKRITQSASLIDEAPQI